MPQIEGSIFSIRLGLPGAGKSLGNCEEDLLPHLLDGQEVYCNYWVNWKGIWTIDDKHPDGYYKQNLHFFTAEDFEELVPTLRNCVLVMDEIGQVMEPRAWEQESGNVRRFFQLHRHHHVDIYGTTQDISLVAKSAWIVVDEWILCHKLGNSLLKQILDWFCKRKSFRIGYQDMTYQELKKLASGWENSSDSEFGSVGGKIRVKRYDIEKLFHRELNDNKVELEHYKCEKCCGRQEKGEFCPKHKEEKLFIVESGLYDTDYDIPIKEKKIRLVAQMPSPEGFRWIDYKGPLSERQTNAKRNAQDKLL